MPSADLESNNVSRASRASNAAARQDKGGHTLGEFPVKLPLRGGSLLRGLVAYDGDARRSAASVVLNRRTSQRRSGSVSLR